MKPLSKINTLFLFTMALGTTHARAGILGEIVREISGPGGAYTPRRSTNYEVPQRTYQEPRRMTEEEQAAAIEAENERIRESNRRYEKEQAERRISEAKQEREEALQFKNYHEPVIKAAGFDPATEKEILNIVRESPFSYGRGTSSLARILTELSQSQDYFSLSKKASRDIFKAAHKIDPNLNDEIIRTAFQRNLDYLNWHYFELGEKVVKWLAAGHNPNLKLANGETPLAWLIRSSPDPSPTWLKTMKTLLAKGGFEKDFVESLSKKSKKADFENFLKSVTKLSYKNLFAHNDCKDDRTITNYLRLDKPDNKVVKRSKYRKNLGYVNLHSQYRHYAFTFSTVEECEQRHAQLQGALDNNRLYGKAIVVASADNWTSAGSTATPPKAPTVEVTEEPKPVRSNNFRPNH